MPINFVGNVESNSAYEGACDVLIADGFSGNVMLKTSEGLAKMGSRWLKNSLYKNAMRVFGALLAKGAFKELKKTVDADAIGGAPLLGINGLCIIGHGSSSPKAVRNAIRTARDAIRFRMNERITERLQECHATVADMEELFK